MTATEDLRRMLDEHGVEYETDDVSDSWYEKTTWSSENNLWWTYEVSTIEKLPYGTLTLLDTGSSNSMTPEQAIAATLGNGEYERKMDALLCRLTNGKFSKTRAYDLDFMESVVREEFETDAAALEAETCHLEEVDKDCGTASEYMIDREWCFDAVYRCSCGYRFGHVAHDRPNFCPNCGCRVREVE